MNIRKKFLEILLIFDFQDDEMCCMAEQCVIVQYLLELAKSLSAVATNTNVIKNFFKKLEFAYLPQIIRIIFRFAAADPSYMKMFKDEVASFQDRLRRRAKEKRDAAIAEYEAEEKVENQFLRIKVSKKKLAPRDFDVFN